MVITEVNIEKDKKIQFLNLHGIWTQDKQGDERTLYECKYILEAAKRKNIPTIISGDFNLLPETESIKILKDNFRDLISEYNIKSTRPVNL